MYDRGFCTVSLVSIGNSTSDPTAVTVTLNYTFSGAAAPGDYSVIAQVSDPVNGFNSPPGTVGTWTVDGTAPPLTIMTSSLTAAAVGTAYSTNLAAQGGAPAYTWSLLSGSLPLGLALSSNGTLSGMPSAPGGSSLTVQATDSAGNRASGNLVLVVAPLRPQSVGVAQQVTPYVYPDGVSRTYSYLLNNGADSRYLTGCGVSGGNVTAAVRTYPGYVNNDITYTGAAAAQAGSRAVTCTWTYSDPYQYISVNIPTGSVQVYPLPNIISVQLLDVNTGEQIQAIPLGGQAFLSIYGTDFGAATGSVNLCPAPTGTCGGSGVTVQQIPYWGQPSGGLWQVNALVSASISVPGPNIYVQLTTFGLAGILLQSNRFTVPVAAWPQFSITSVAFTGAYQLAADNGHTLPPPVIDSTVWRASCSSPPCTNPSAFEQGTRMAATATFSLNPIPSATLGTIRIEGGISGLGILSGTTTVSAGQASVTVNVTADTVLPAGTRIYNPMNISWRNARSDVPCSQASCASAGNSSSTVYVTMARPPESNLPLPLTTLSLAVAGGGAATPAAAFQNTWARFSNGGNSPANLLTWDGRPLQYYPYGHGFMMCARSSSELLNVDDGRGQCGSLKFLLSDALLVNGIFTDPVTISNVDGDRFLVKSWVFGGADPMYAPYSWPVLLQIEPGGIPGMVPLPVGSVFGQIVSLSDLPGQNTAPPSEKIFNLHFILKDTSGISGSGPYFDPSYGVTYLNACDPQLGFEQKAVDGYLRQLSIDLPSPTNFHARMKDPGACKMQFSQ